MKKVKHVLAGCLCVCALSMCTFPALAAPATTPSAETTKNETVVIKLFDPNDPHLISITDASDTSKTTSRPTAHLDLRYNSPYYYSAYSNKNIMWTKYIFDNSGNNFKIEGTATNPNYIIIVHNGDDGNDYTYDGATSFELISEKESVGAPSEFYFGFDTKTNGGSVSVDGQANSY